MFSPLSDDRWVWLMVMKKRGPSWNGTNPGIPATWNGTLRRRQLIVSAQWLPAARAKQKMPFMRWSYL